MALTRIGTEAFGDSVITEAKLASNSVTSAKITDGAIATADIADDAVTADKLANSINTEITANTAKVTNATHTGDVTGATALTIATDAVDIAMLSATGTADATTFLRGDNSWQIVSSTPDLTTEGDLYKNYKTVASTLSTPVDANSQQGLIGPITITGDWTLVGDVTIW